MTLTLAPLQQFTGSETIYRHALNNKVVYTDGVRYLAREGGAYWLIDEIALAQRFNRKLSSEAFQVWTLTVNNEDHSGILICDDGNGTVLVRKRIPFTDFPLQKIKLYFTNNTIWLPRETPSLLATVLSLTRRRHNDRKH